LGNQCNVTGVRRSGPLRSSRFAVG
jgi:hypothetical protein